MTRSQKLLALAVGAPIALAILGGSVLWLTASPRGGDPGLLAVITVAILCIWSFFLPATAAVWYAQPASRRMRVALGWLVFVLSCVYLVAGGIGFLALAFWVGPYLGATLIIFLPISLIMFYYQLKPSIAVAYSAEQERVAREGPVPRRKKVLWTALTFGGIVVLFLAAGGLAETADALGAEIVARIISSGFAIFMLIVLAVSLTSLYLHWQARSGGTGSKAGRIQ